MSALRQTYDNEKQTFPRCTALTGIEFKALPGNILELSFSGSPSGDEQPTDDFKPGDYIVGLAEEFVGEVMRVVDGIRLELWENHGLDSDTPLEEVDVSIIKAAPGFKSVSFVIGPDAGGKITDKKGGEQTYPAGFGDGGTGYIDADSFPLVVDATGTEIYVTGNF